MKKYIGYIIPVIFLTSTLASCKKDQAIIQDYSALLTVVNATTNQASLVTNFTGGQINFSEEIQANVHPYYYWNGYENGSAKLYGLHIGKPLPIKVFDISDTLHPLFEKTVTFQPADYYTLYIAGQVGAIDTLLIKENIPLRTDSTFGVRVINLSSNAGPISINLSDQAPGSEIASLPYKEMTEFKGYPAGAENNTYRFECRDAITDELLASYEFNAFSNFVPRFNNVTFLLRGVRGGSPALQLNRINNF